MITFVNKLNEVKTDIFLNGMSVKYTKEDTEKSPNVIKYTITSHKEQHKMLFIIDEVLERFHDVLLSKQGK